MNVFNSTGRRILRLRERSNLAMLPRCFAYSGDEPLSGRVLSADAIVRVRRQERALAQAADPRGCR
jgi:hypothetical protein